MTRPEGDGSRPQTGEPDTDDLQFDRVEPADAAASDGDGGGDAGAAQTAGAVAPTCSRCKAPLADAYYEAGGQVFCPRCRDAAVAAQTGGSRMGRVFGAISYGVFAGLGGTLLWFAVRKLTGYEVGLIAVLVGLMVGGAVRAGSGARGGKFYQFLAMFLTYTAIVANYVPDVFEMMYNEFKKQEAADVSAAGSGATTQPTTTLATARATTTQPTTAPTLAGVEPDYEEAVPVESPTGEILVGDDGAAEDGLPGGVLGALLAVALLCILVFVVAFFAPILAGFENIIGLLIIGFALWEAWKLNRRQSLDFNGPYAVGSMPPPVPPPAGATG